MADQTDNSKVILSPTTYERHRAAFDYVAQQVVTRDPRKGIPRFPGVAPGAWGLLASGATLTGANGTTLGGGTVRLCSLTGEIYDPDQPITAANAGAEFTADQDTVLPLEWTAGIWSTCICGTPVPTCGEPCGTICDGSYYSIPGTVTTAAGSKPIGKAFQEITGGWTAPPSEAGIYDSGVDRWVFDEGLGEFGCYKVEGTFKYFFGFICDGTDIKVQIYLNSAEYTGAGEGDPIDVDGCGNFWPNGVMNDADSDLFEAGFYQFAAETTASVDSCEGGVITLSFDFGFLFTYATDPPLSGTITLPIVPDTLTYTCCDECKLPRHDLVLTIAEVTSALTFDDATSTWTDVVNGFSFGCGAHGVAISGGEDIWTFVPEGSTCDPLHLIFHRESPDTTIYVDEP